MSKSSDHVKKWRRATKHRIVESFGNICCICKNRYPDVVYDLHHENGEKEFQISSIRANAVSWIRIVTELRKCVMVCSNCHRLVHNGDTVIPEDANKFDESFANYFFDKHHNMCPVCGSVKLKRMKYCSPICASIGNRRVERPGKEQLIDLLSTYSYVRVGKMFGVTDNAVRKWLKH